MARIGLNFVGAVGVGKKARIVRSKSRVTKLFVTKGRGVLGDAVRTCGMTWEGVAAVGSAMVEGGGSVIDPCRLT